MDVIDVAREASEQDVFYAYTYGTAGWLSLQASALIIAPKVIVNMLSTGVRDVTALEVYLSRALGLSLLTLSITTIVLTGSIPLTSRISDGVAEGSDAHNPRAPYAVPTMFTTAVYHAAMAFYCYMNWTATGVSGFALGVLGSTLLAAFGGWNILFGSNSGKFSSKTGADKRTSGFPFKNVESASEKKRALKNA